MALCAVGSAKREAVSDDRFAGELCSEDCFVSADLSIICLPGADSPKLVQFASTALHCSTSGSSVGKAMLRGRRTMHDDSVMFQKQEATNTKIELDNGEEGGKVSFSGSACSHAAGKEEHNYALEVIYACLFVPSKACTITILVSLGASMF